MKLLVRYPTVAVILVAVSVWVVLSAIVLVSFWPWYPRTPTQWVVFVMVGVPFAVGMQYLGERLFSPQVGSKISTRKFSWLRILYSLVAMLLLLAALWAGASLFAALAG
jgi:hypothetical protein